VKVVVQGLWHLGTVVAACLAAAGHEVVGLDGDGARTRGLAAGCPPVFEPGLEALVREGLSRGRLRFTSDPAEACAGAEALWVAYDTPVDDDDRADVAFVVAEVERVWPWLPPAALVVVSSQVPVGTTRNLERAYRAAYPAHEVSFVYSPENLRLGRAIEVFRNPDRVIYYILSLGTTEVWLRFVGGWNATRDYGSQGGLGVGFTLHALEIGDFFVAYGINFYFINEFMAFGLGQAFLSLAMRI